LYADIRHALKDFYWFIRHNTINRYHIIDIRSKVNGYSYGWRDTDNRMFYACFALFKEFMEKEKPFDRIAYEPEDEAQANDPSMKDYWVEAAEQKIGMTELYEWCTKGRASEAQALEDMSDTLPEGVVFTESEIIFRTNTPVWRAYLTAVEAFEGKDDEMFDKLMRIRHSLWT